MVNSRTVHLLIAFAILPMAVDPLAAHHAFAPVFDPSKKLTLTGTVTRIDWRNPHIELSLDAKNDGGDIESWAIEGGPPNFFQRRNVSKTTFENAVGHTVTVEAFPARDGSLWGILLKITFPDGTIVLSQPGS